MYCLEEVAMIEKVQETHLYKWLCEKNSEFLGQVNEAIRYAETMLPLISKVFSDYTVYAAQALLFSIKWAEKFGQDEIDGMVRRARNSITNFNDFKNTVPKWYSDRSDMK